MKTTIKDMIELLKKKLQETDNEIAAVDRKVEVVRQNEIQNLREKSNNLGEAISILSKEYSQKPDDFKLSPDAYKQIMEWLDKKLSHYGAIL